MQKVQNTFENGLNQDSLETLQPQGTYRYALNAVRDSRDDKRFGLSSEEANKIVATVGAEIVGSHYIESINKSALFLVGDSIALFDHQSYGVEHVASASEFGCEWGFNECEWITAIHKTMQPCSEINLYWSSNCTYYSINLAEMLDPVRKAALIASFASGRQGNCEYNCDYFKLMKCICTPKVVGTVKDRGGHGLEGGFIEVSVRLRDKAGNTTNWSPFSKPVYINSENFLPGERSNSAVDIHITDLDCRYGVVDIAVRRTANGVSTTELVESRNYTTSGITFTYIGQKGITVDLEEILIKRKTYIRGRDIAQKDGRAWLYSIRQEKNPDMQRRVNEAELMYTYNLYPATDVDKYNIKSLQRGENYLFGVVYNYCDGTHTHVFPLIPKGDCNTESPGVFSGGAPLSTPGDTSYYKTKREWGKDRYGELRQPTGGGGDTLLRLGNNLRSLTEPLDEWQTDLSNWENSARCDDCHEPWCCEEVDGGVQIITNPDNNNCEGCHEDELFIQRDGPKIELAVEDHNDALSSYGEDKERYEIEYGKSSELRDSSANLLRDAVDEQPVPILVSTTRSVEKPGGGGGGSSVITAFNQGVRVPWSGITTDGDGNLLVRPSQSIVVEPGVACTRNLYPDTNTCTGEKVYGGLANTNIKLFRTPTEARAPLYANIGAKHVPSETTPSEDPIHDRVLGIIGIQVNNVPLPQDEEEEMRWFPKPLCKNSPFRIVMVERDYINSTVQANGLATSMFSGVVGGEVYAFPRHGLCSRETLDRHIGSTIMNSSRDGFSGGPSANMYNFHGLDTNIARVGLSAESIRVNSRFNGTGERYGLYQEGKEPADGLNGRRVDQRGARQYINLYSRSGVDTLIPIIDAIYVQANTVARSGSMSASISNLFRESSVVTELTGQMPGGQEDLSFIADGYNHKATIVAAHGWYCSFIKNLPDQYGSLPGMRFIDTGIQAVGYNSNVKGQTGDVYVGTYTFKRSGFVSDKIGSLYLIEGTHRGEFCGERNQTICESRETTLVEELGIDDYPTKFPRDGEVCDQRNWANGYHGEPREPDSWIEAIGGARTSDIYYPKVQKTLVSCVIESRVNPWKRATDIFDNRDFGRYYYPKLHGHALDSDATHRAPWEESYINRIYFEVQQPSRAQMLKKFFYKSLVNVMLPTILLALGIDASEDVTSLTAFGFSAPVLLAYWELMKDYLLREDYLDQMLGITSCRIDTEGGENTNHIRGFEDNWHDYNFDYSEVGRLNVYEAMPLDYNTCECDDCEEKQETTNEIFYSQKQIIGSQIDTYRVFHSFSYLEIPAEAGKLTKLNNFAGNFYAHTTDGLFIIRYNSITSQSSIGTSLLGGNEMVVDPVRFFEGLAQGYAGLQDPNSLINTPYGVVWIDQEAGKPYLFTGQSPINLGGYMDNFLREHLPFCAKGACHDERTSTFYVHGYDPRYNRIMLTKVDGNDKFTMSFIPGQEEGGMPAIWISFHSYTPKEYLWDRYNMFSIEPGGKIYRHNMKGKYLEFDGEKQPFIVDLITNTNGRDWFKYKATEIHTHAEKGQLKGLDTTFNKAALRNYTQGSGTMNLRLVGDNKGTDESMPEHITEKGDILMKKARRKYYFDRVWDNTKPGCGDKPNLIWNDCTHTWEINESIYDCSPPNRQRFENRNYQDEFLNYRFVWDNGDGETNLKLISIQTDVDYETK